MNERADECGPTHHAACACREAEHAAEVARLTSERDAARACTDDHYAQRRRWEDGYWSAIRERDAARAVVDAARALVTREEGDHSTRETREAYLHLRAALARLDGVT